MADLFGKRLVISSESSEDGSLNLSKIKLLTGGERIRARRMREDTWEFDATHKVILCTNHKPKVPGVDAAFWRRVRLVPFEVSFWDSEDPNCQGKDLPSELKQDKSLPDKLKSESEGILAWLVQGCLDWQRDGLSLPDKVRVATGAYRDSEDVFGQFVAERCLIGSDYRCKSADLFAAFTKWTDASKEISMTKKAFGDLMTMLKYERLPSNGVWYKGIALRPSTEGLEGCTEGLNDLFS
jgi:putative DNA primase/helicase